MQDIFDVVVLGGGPAGATAALFAGRAGRKPLLMAGSPGSSLIAGAPEIDNFPGVSRMAGGDFIQELHMQCHEAGVPRQDVAAQSVFLENRLKMVRTPAGLVAGKALIVAVGTTPLKPPIEGLEQFWGKGISTCAWCDGPWFRDKRVAVYGGGNTAFSSADLLSRLAREVHVLLPKGRGTAFSSVQEKIRGRPGVTIHPMVEIKRVAGDQRLRHILLERDGVSETWELDGLFVAMGQKPNTLFLKDFLELTRSGFIPADALGKTAIPGVFAAGDVVEGQFRQLVVACGTGANAALAAEQYLSAQW